MNKRGKLLLVATSLTPIFLVCAINSLMNERFRSAGAFACIFFVLTIVFFWLFYRVRGILPTEELSTDKVKAADKEVLAFLLSYLLPFFAKPDTSFGGEVVTALTIVVVIGSIIYHSSAYTFNPLLAFLDYHFYEVESGGMTFLLITKTHIRTPQNKFVVRHMCDYIYIAEQSND
jgi:hypothetical protein